MKPFLKQIITSSLLIVLGLAWNTTISAQEDPAYNKAMEEIKQTFGTVPVMFEVFPKYALAGAWENFKALSGPQSLIPGKYRELLQLAVASQIPCQYCIYFHAAAAKANGATDAEIQEAVAQGAQTRHWSMILQGNQINFDEFKTEFDAIMKNMAAGTEK
jgi:AhpD family alkylhydroperoxidase